jgi:carboxyl-terminal processing protease
MQGLILDVRFNPGGLLEEAEQVVDLFLEKGTIVSIKGRARAERTREASGPGTLPPFPMIVLVNEHSASASEIVAGSLMDNKRALVLGTRTYGKGSVQEVIPLDSKSGELKLTVAYYYLPSGRLVHRKKDATDWGVEPQINVFMDEATQRKVMLERFEAENFKRPVVKTTTRPTTQQAQASSTQPATQPAQMTDSQLQRAVDTLVALIVLQGNRNELALAAPRAGAPHSTVSVEVTAPTTAPTTTPAMRD